MSNIMLDILIAIFQFNIIIILNPTIIPQLNDVKLANRTWVQANGVSFQPSGSAPGHSLCNLVPGRALWPRPYKALVTYSYSRLTAGTVSMALKKHMSLSYS